MESEAQTDQTPAQNHTAGKGAAELRNGLPRACSLQPYTVAETWGHSPAWWACLRTGG